MLREVDTDSYKKKEGTKGGTRPREDARGTGAASRRRKTRASFSQALMLNQKRGGRGAPTSPDRIGKKPRRAMRLRQKSGVRRRRPCLKMLIGGRCIFGCVEQLRDFQIVQAPQNFTSTMASRDPHSSL